MRWYLRVLYASIGFGIAVLAAHAEPEYASHPEWHVPVTLIAVSWAALLAGVAESAVRRR